MYKSYKEGKPVYFSLDEYLIFIIPMLAIAGLSYASLYFFGLYPTTVLVLILSLLINFIYIGLKNASPNGSRSAPTIFSGSSLSSYFVIVLAITIVDVGIYVLFLYQKTHIFYEYLFYSWVFIMLGLPLLYLIFLHGQYQYLLYTQASQFTDIAVEIYYDHELLVKVEALCFNNTQKKNTAEFLFSYPRSYQSLQQIGEMDIEDRNEFLYAPAFREHVKVPQHSDQMQISWYSIEEETYYKGIIDFPFEQLLFEPNKYPLDQPKIVRGQKTDTLKVVIHPKGSFDLFTGSRLLLQHRCPKISDEEKQAKLIALKNTRRSNLPKNNIDTLPADSKAADRVANRAQIRDALFFCSLNIQGAKHQLLEIKGIENKVVDIKVEGADMLIPPVRQTLPTYIAMSGSGTGWKRWLVIHLDIERLYELLKNRKTDTFEICLTVEMDKGNVCLDIKIEGVLCGWTHWEKTIDRENLKLALEKLKERNEREVKNAVWNEIYTLMEAKQYMAAQERCRRAFKEDPEDMMLYFYDARLLYYTKGQEACYKKEAYYLDKTAHDKYAWAQINNNYGCMLDEDLKYEEALAYFQKASEVMPEIADYIANQAEIYYKIGKAKQAVDYALQSQQKGGDFKILKEILQNKGKIKA